MYRVETHLHTWPVSRCAKATVEESLDYYKSLSYDAVFVTNHFINSNTIIEGLGSYEEKLNFYFSDYERAVEYGKEIGLKVFCGIEMAYKKADFLIYGLDKEWFLNHPEIEEMPIDEKLDFMMENGALVIQAHPFRLGGKIKYLRLFPNRVHGVEIINSSRNEFENDMAKFYCEKYNLIEFAGSDNHTASKRKLLSGVSFDEPILSVQDFIEKVKNRKGKVFHIGLYVGA